jgi:hypothetical protein
MPHASVIYQKSAKGSQAIATRDHALSPKLRSLLILVDGKRSFEDLVKLSGPLGDTDQLLAQLHEQGYIEPAAQAAPAAPVSAPAPLQGSGVVPLAEAKRYIVRRLTDLLGPTADSFCMKIEAAKNAHDFMVVVKDAEILVRDMKGTQTASNFHQEVESHRPI